MLNTSFSALSASQRAFVSAVCADLRSNRDASQIAVLGDGSTSPQGERFAARRLGHSWEVVFNFPADDVAYATDVQLPTYWEIAA